MCALLMVKHCCVHLPSFFSENKQFQHVVLSGELLLVPSYTEKERSLRTQTVGKLEEERSFIILTVLQ